VHGHELVVQFWGDEIGVGGREFSTKDFRKSAADKEEEKSSNEVLNPDYLVVGTEGKVIGRWWITASVPVVISAVVVIGSWEGR
jgi:hypothetical protein